MIVIEKTRAATVGKRFTEILNRFIIYKYLDLINGDISALNWNNNLSFTSFTCW